MIFEACGKFRQGGAASFLHMNDSILRLAASANVLGATSESYSSELVGPCTHALLQCVAFHGMPVHSFERHISTLFIMCDI